MAALPVRRGAPAPARAAARPALAASVNLVVVLEVLKFRGIRERQIRRQVESGEIEAVRPPETGEFEAVGRD